MSFFARVLIFLLMSSATEVMAQTAKELEGHWVCQGVACACQPSSPGKYTQIKLNNGVLSLQNECGDVAAAALQPNSIIYSQDWNLHGTISRDNKLITWDNKSVWARLVGVSELEQRLAYWEGKVFFCNYEKSSATKFPSKETEHRDGCDDGDVVLENAMLCLAGDGRGCDAVRRSQDTHGRWWRSPQKSATRPDEPKALDLKDLTGEGTGQTTFSNDHAIGVWAYLTTQNDIDAFKYWIKWIDTNPRCTILCAPLPVGTPRYCAHDKCTFSFIDCPALELIGGLFGQPVTVCSLLTPPLPPLRSLAAELRHTFDDATKRLPPAPEIIAIKKLFDASIKIYDETFQKLDDARSLLEEKLLKKARVAAIVSEINARLNQGYSIYNSMVTILLLEKWGIGSEQLSETARDIARKYPKNPIFEYVAYRKTRQEQMLKLILDLDGGCPSEANDKDHARVEWAWEREPKDQAWKKTMYWDCIFAAELWKNPTIALPDANKENELEKIALKHFEELKKALDFADSNVRKIIDSIPKGIPNTVDLGSPPGPKPPIDCHLIPFGTPGSCQGPKISIKIPKIKIKAPKW